MLIGAVTAPVLLALAFAGFLWSASGQLLFPSWKGATRDLAHCPPALEAAWGPACGNLRVSSALRFREVSVPSLNGHALPGWLVGAAENGAGPAAGAILLVHGGGGDRREMTRRIRPFLDRHLDVLTVDLTCAGEAPCPVPGLSYGGREARDVLSAYLFLARDHARVLALGNSVGATSVLLALPGMPGLAAAILENPAPPFDQLITEAPEARSVPGWMLRALIGLAKLRGRFDALPDPASALRLAGPAPVWFVHARHDAVIPWQRTEALAAQRRGTDAAWISEAGDHGVVWDADRGGYEARLDAFLGRALSR